MRAIGAWAIRAAVACGLATATIAQSHLPDDDYLGVVRSYRDGDAEAAVRQFAALDRERVATGFAAFTARVMAGDDPRHPAATAAATAADLVTAAAAAHTEVALRPRVPASAEVIELPGDA